MARIERRGLEIALLALAALLMAPLLAGHMPMSHDHPVHLYMAWTLWQHLITHGRLSGWDNGWFFGYPAGDLYPVGSSLWIAAFRALTLGQLGWEQTYALAYAGFFALSAWSVYTLGTRLVGTRAGAIAAALWMLDPGDFREGGWWYVEVYGVWPQVLGLAFALFGLAALEEGLASGRPRDLARAGLAFGLALLGHPTTILVLGTALPLWLGARAWLDRRPARRELLWAAAACTCGLGVAAFWQVPMLSRTGWTSDIGEMWMTLPELAGVFVQHGAPWWNGWPVLTLAFFGGAAWGWRRRDSAVVFLAVWSVLLIVAATSTPYTVLRLDRISHAFAKIQYERLVIIAKVAWFLVAAYALDQVGEAVVGAWRARRPSLGLVAASLAALAFFAWVGKEAAHWTVQYTSQSFMDPAGSGDTWEDSRAFVAWAREKRSQSADFYRIAVDLGEHDHYLLATPIETGTPIYKVGYTPVNLFRSTVVDMRADLFTALNVRYLVRRADLHLATLVPEVTLGALHIFRYTGYSPLRATLIGAGQIGTEEVGNALIHLRLQGTAPDSRVVLHVSDYDRWEARMNGAIAPIGEAPPGNNLPPMLMDIPVTDGDLVVRWVDRPVDQISAAISVLALGLVAVLLAGERRILAVADRIRPQIDLLARVFGGLVLIAVLVGLLGAAWRWEYGTPATNQPNPWKEGGREPPR